MLTSTSKASLLFQTHDAPANAVYMRLMYINTGGNVPTGIVVGDMKGVALPDGTHPSQYGHDKMATLFYEEIKKYLII